MAPLIRLFALLALSTAVLASPHVSRNVYNHAHRAVARPPIDMEARAALHLPRRQRSLNKRCVPRPTANSTSAVPTSAVPTTSAVSTSAAPINVAPVPTLPTSSSSSYVPPSQAPSPTSSASPSEAPSPSTTPPPPSTSTSSTVAPAQTSSSSSNTGEPSYMTGTQTGQGTFFADGLGACGVTNTDSQDIVAVSELLFDSYPGYDGVNPNTNPVCGKSITATYLGQSVAVVVTDRCTACNITDLDFSTGAFNSIADPSLGRIDLTWVWG